MSTSTVNPLVHLATTEDTSELAPVLIGDYIVLQDLNIENPGFVTGDPAFQRCGVQKFPSKGEVLEYDDYAFQIFPSMIYRSRQEQKMKHGNRKRSSTRSNSRGSGRERSTSITAGDFQEREREEKMLHERIEHEDRLNESTIKEVVSGERREPLRYGQLVQLYHLKSGLFVSCHHTAALKDAACRKVSLREGSISAQFELLPCFKAQTEGSVVFYTHSIKLGSVKLNGSMFLHTSNAVYEDMMNPDGPATPLCLKTQPTLELNASSKFTTFMIRKYGGFKPGTQDSVRSSFSPFRLYHSQSESFIIASCNKDKNAQSDKIRSKKFKGIGDEPDRDLVLPAHLPYLRQVDQVTSNEEPDPTDPRNHSSKAVWVFETLSRKTSDTISWSDDVRIRHVPSGRYLCVDTSRPFHVLPPNEAWYRTYLVVDSTEDKGLIAHKPYDYCTPEATIFKIETEGGMGSDIPRNISHARVEFKTEVKGMSLHLFLHNAEVEKPRMGNSTKSSMSSKLLVFSTQRSAQDTLKIMPIGDEERTASFQAGAFVPIVMAYAERVADPEKPLPTHEKLQDIMVALIKIINFQSKSAQETTSFDWIKKANSMLPSAFSALFEGEPNELAQRISRDCKLLDAVFTMSLAPYQRLSNPFGGTEKEKMLGCAGIQKLAQVALQRMFVRNTESQLYFRRTSHLNRPVHTWQDETADAYPKTWMDLVKLQLEDPLGSAVSLSKLLSSNGSLLRTYATPDMVHEFARMIRQLGPQPRLVVFFESICAIGSMPVKSNQEMILRIAWRLTENREKLFVEMKTLNNSRSKPFGEVSRLPNGELKEHAAVATKTSSQDIPDDYLGKKDLEAGFDPVFVHWKGHSKWKQRMEDFLFFSASEMTNPQKGKGLPTISHGDHDLVRIEDFCWVLEPARLCYAVTGESWDNLESLRENDDEFKARFARQEQLVQYFVAEISMLTRLCFGRSYNCIRMLQETFTYPMLISVIQNEHLPCTVRAAMLNLCRVIYVDRFPQMKNCARPSIPEVLWVFDEGDMPKEDMVATPIIHPISLKSAKSEFAFPRFQISQSHKFFNDPDPFIGFPDHHKFHLLTTGLSNILDSFDSGRIDHNNKSMNALATQTVTALSDLLSFGFLSSYDKMQKLVTSLVRLLDGRRDVMKVEYNGEDYADVEGFTPPKLRFELTSNSTSVTGLKNAILDVLLVVSDFRCQFRLGKLLQLFKDCYLDKKQLKELKYFHACKLEEEPYEGFLNKELYEQFENLFTMGDGKLLDFEEMSGQPLMTILLDCLMYKDDRVHAKALELLERTYTQRFQLLQAIDNVILLQTAPYYPQLNADINYFVLLLRSTEVWAVSSKISGEFDKKKEKDFYEMVKSINKYLHYQMEDKEVLRQSLVSSLITGTMPKNISMPNMNLPSLPKNMTKNITQATGIQMGRVGSFTQAGTATADIQTPTSPAAFKEVKHHQPVKEHQDMLRAMNVQFALTMALAIDYNLAFKGSICSADEKIKSRNIHIDVLRNVVAILKDFVVGNDKNQDTILINALPYLREHMGVLQVPSIPSDFSEKQKSQLVTFPGLDTESVIIECLRGNVRQCEEVPLALFNEFGKLLNEVPDCSESNLIEFFYITILPDPTMDALFRNQESTLDQLLSRRYPHTLEQIQGCFCIEGKPLPKHPHVIVNLLSKCIQNVNSLTSARLQAQGITIDATFEALVNKVYLSIDEHKKSDCPPASPKHEDRAARQKREQIFQDDDHFCSLVIFLDHQLLSLVIDPRMYQREEMWRVICEGVAVLLSAFATSLDKCVAGAGSEGVIKLITLILPCLRVVHEFVKGATLMGADDLMSSFHNDLRAEGDFSNSVYESMVRIRKRIDHFDKMKKQNFPDELGILEEKIIKAVRGLQHFLVPNSESYNEDVDVMLHKGDDENAPPSRRSSLDKSISPKAAEPPDTPELLLSYYVEALMANPKITQRLLSRKFEFLNVLESVEARTTPATEKNEKRLEELQKPKDAHTPHGFQHLGSALEHVVDRVAHLTTDDHTQEKDEPLYGVRIQWPMIVVRLVDYLRLHNFDDEITLIRVHNVLRNHVLKARSVESNTKVLDSSEMSFDDVEKFRQVQDKLDSAGVTQVALLAIATHTPGARDTAAVSAIELLRELLFSGNKQVQASVLHYIEFVDKDARFLKHIRSRLTESSHYIKERNDQVRINYAPMQREHQLEYGEAEQTLKLLTEMLEGHNLAVQNIIRAQPLQSADVDLVKQAFDILNLQAGQAHLLRRMGDPSVDLLNSTLVFIIECMQGPCDGNQLALAKSETTITTVKNVLTSPFSSRIPAYEIMRVKAKAILIFAACLEGRKDKLVHDILVDHLDPGLLQSFASEITEFIKDTINGTPDWSKDDHFRKKVITDALQGLVALANTRTEMNLVGNFTTENFLIDANKGRAAAERMLRQKVASVEVMWNGRVEFVSFPLPKATPFLSAATKTKFLDNVDLSTHEKRMKELMRAEPSLTAEMQQVYVLAKKSWSYNFMHEHFLTIKLLQYALVLLVNLNVIMTGYGDNKETDNGGKAHLGYTSAYRGAFVEEVDKKYRWSLYFTYLLGVPNFLGYLCNMGYVAITEVPIVIREIEALVRDKETEAKNGMDVMKRDSSAFTWWGVTLAFNVIFIILHLAAYPGDEQPLLYAFLILGINLPWTLLCIRNYIVVPDTINTRRYAIIFDSLFTHAFLRNQMILVFCSVNGFRFSSYFTLMLLDVANISTTVQSLVKSITKPAPQLGIVAYLFIIMVVIFASFGLEYFENYFHYDMDYEDDADDLSKPNPYGCHSVVACFWLILYKGVPDGTLDQVLDFVTNRDPLYLGRVFYDTLFFIIVGVFLFNVITGLIVDTFSSLREEAASRADQLYNECYVCGFTRTAYDDIGMLSPSFDQHKLKNHYIWNYLYFIQHIQTKDQTDFSGVESYVHDMLQMKCLDWLPARTSFASQNFGMSDKKNDAIKEREKRLTTQMDASFDMMSKKMSEIANQVATLEKNMKLQMEEREEHLTNQMKTLEQAFKRGTSSGVSI